MKFCQHCGAQLEDDNARFCSKCGASVSESEKKDNVSDDLHNVVHPNVEGEDVSQKSRAIATVLAWFLGFVGGHNYYLGKTTMAILMTVFSGQEFLQLSDLSNSSSL